MSLNQIFSQKAEKDIKREIVVELLDSNQNLDEKTQLGKPLRWACLRSMKGYIGELKLPKSEAILEGFIKQAHKFLISKDRQGRKEYIESLKALGKIDEKEEKSEKEAILGR